MLRHLWPDIRYGARMLLRHPTLSIASVLTFGLGIGLATAVFSIVNGVLLKGLPFEEGDRIVLVAGTDTAAGDRLAGIPVHDYAVYEERQTVFDAIGAFRWVSMNLSWDERNPERFPGAALSVGALRAMRVKPVIGRLFRDGEDRPGADPVILIGHQLWRDAFAGAPGAIGRTIVANGVARAVVGVMPERFGFPNLEQVWIPLVIDPLATPRGRGPQYEVIARLRPGVSTASARAQMASPFLYRVHPRDPAVLITVLVTLGATALAAGFLGVRRIVHLDPASVLGDE